MWSSSLTDSITRGKPDNGSVDFSARISGLNEMMRRNDKPVVLMQITEGRIEHIHYTVKTLKGLVFQQ